MKKTLLFAIVAVIITTSLYAKTNKYRLSLRDNPATTIVIGWNQVSDSVPVVYYGTTDYGRNYSSYPNSQAVSRSIKFQGMENKFARLTGLLPDTAYYFVIKDSKDTSNRYWFKTAPDVPTQRLSFIAGGDSRSNAGPRRNGNLMVSKLRPHAILFSGDLTNSSSSSELAEWLEDWQLTISSDGRMYPIIVATGNHEVDNVPNVVLNLFDTPSDNVYYAISFGGNLARVYSLNTHYDVNIQNTWFGNDLAANSNSLWKFAQYHIPIRSTGKGGGTGNSDAWKQTIYNNRVRLASEADAHTFKTTWPIRPSTQAGSEDGFIRDDVNGTVFIGEGCWGAPLRTDDAARGWTRDHGMFDQFSWVFVDKDTTEVRTIKFANASSVGQNTNENPFAIPANLDIYKSSNTPTGILYIPRIVVPTVSISPSKVTLIINKTKQLSAVFSPFYVPDKTVSWSSDDTTVVKVSTNGLITAVSSGLATIQVTSLQDTSKKATATITVSDLAGAVTYQAEKAQLSGAVLASNQSGYNGTGFVSFVNASNDFISWKVNVATAGNYNLSFKYALESGNSPLSLKINDSVKVASLDFPATNSWSTWGTITSNQYLKAGDNTIILSAIGVIGGNIDEMVVLKAEPTAIDKNISVASSGISVKPNPTNTILYIDGLTETTDVTVKSVSGQMVMKVKTSREINVSQLPSGIYFLNAGKNKSVSFIKN